MFWTPAGRSNATNVSCNDTNVTCNASNVTNATFVNGTNATVTELTETEALAAAMFGQADLDSDGVVSAAEFIELCVDKTGLTDTCTVVEMAVRRGKARSTSGPATGERSAMPSTTPGT